jgi:hypothetical protein
VGSKILIFCAEAMGEGLCTCPWSAGPPAFSSEDKLCQHPRMDEAFLLDGEGRLAVDEVESC